MSSSRAWSLQSMSTQLRFFFTSRRSTKSHQIISPSPTSFINSPKSHIIASPVISSGGLSLHPGYLASQVSRNIKLSSSTLKTPLLLIVHPPILITIQFPYFGCLMMPRGTSTFTCPLAMNLDPHVQSFGTKMGTSSPA